MELRLTKTTRKVYRQAYLGNVLLEVGDAPYKGHFSFKCMTGKRDRNKNTFFGIVRAMKDPARWSNKWMSQTMHIMNTTAKGGIAVEQGQFFANDADGEASWALQDQVTKLKPGALSGTNPKWIPKPVSQFPQGSFELMQYAVQSHRDVADLRDAEPALFGNTLPSASVATDAGQVAAEVRSRIGLDVDTQASWKTDAAAFNRLRSLVEAQGVFVYQVNASTTDDWRGIAIFDERKIPVIVINSNETFPAAKSFTLFHEYAGRL